MSDEVTPFMAAFIDGTLSAPLGWQCPVCGNVYAPTVPICQSNHYRPHITVGRGTTDPAPSLVAESTQL